MQKGHPPHGGYPSEIADLLKLNRSTVYRHRTSGLALIKKFMEEFEE